MTYGEANNEIVKIIKEDYMKQYFKVSKIFQILVTGYNASKHKTLQVFKEHGWELYSEPLPGDEIMSFLFVYREPVIKMNVTFYVDKNLKTGVLCEDSESKTGYIDITIDKSNKLFEYVKQLVAVTNLESFSYMEHEKIIYTIITKDDGGYILQFSYPNY